MIRGKRSFRSVRVAVPMLLLAMLLALGVTACGDSTSEDSGSTSATNSSDTSSDSSSGDSGVVEAKGEITSEDVETGTAFTGGKAGKASGEPIKVGLVVPVQGALAGPFFPPTAKSAVTLVNDHLGGVGGRPLELVECTFGGTAEQGQACGAKMANDPDVKAVLYIPGAAGTQEFHAALDGKKVSLCSLATPTETKVPNQFCISAGAMALAAAATYIKDELNAKTVATVLPDDPAFRELARSQKETFESLGIEQTFGFIPPQATDVTAAITASKAQTADVVLLELPSPAACVPVAKALEQLGIDKPTISNPPSCLDPSVEKALGEKPAWTYQAFGPTVYAPARRGAALGGHAEDVRALRRGPRDVLRAAVRKRAAVDQGVQRARARRPGDRRDRRQDRGLSGPRVPR
jgi:branched-chain amino acid transport system substrate-binding protein